MLSGLKDVFSLRVRKSVKIKGLIQHLILSENSDSQVLKYSVEMDS
jgi:hypothetical protein